MYEQEIIKCLKNLGKQVYSLQQLMVNLDRDVRNMRVSGNTIVKTMPLGVKDLTTAQLVDAYVRYDLTMEQMLTLSDGRMSQQDIIKRLRRAGAIQ